MALSLALLVLISTTGFSMNVMFCSCTGKQYIAILASKLHFSCCKAQLVKAANNCCKKTKTNCNRSNKKDGATILADKDCCSSIFKWKKANINLDLIQQLELPTAHFKILSNYWKTPIYQIALPVFPLTIALIGTPNKAPPRFEGSFQNWFQIYHC